jgi:hypothetical protein
MSRPAEPEPAPYLIEHIREELQKNPDVGEIDIHVSVDGRRVVVTGNVSTQQRHDSITAALGDMLPEYEVHNETVVAVFPEAPEEGST